MPVFIADKIMPAHGWTWDNAKCLECLDTGLIWSSLRASPAHCQRCLASEPGELFLSEAARTFRRAVFERQTCNRDIARAHFHIARALTLATADAPLPRVAIDEAFMMSERKSKETLAFLRDNWLLPISARKSQPSGYWLAASLNELHDWAGMSRRTAIAQLAVIYKVLRANTPRLAGQEPLDFVQQITAELEQEVLH